MDPGVPFCHPPLRRLFGRRLKDYLVPPASGALSSGLVKSLSDRPDLLNGVLNVDRRLRSLLLSRQFHCREFFRGVLLLLRLRSKAPGLAWNGDLRPSSGGTEADESILVLLGAREMNGRHEEGK